MPDLKLFSLNKVTLNQTFKIYLRTVILKEINFAHDLPLQARIQEFSKVGGGESDPVKKISPQIFSLSQLEKQIKKNPKNFQSPISWGGGGGVKI
jgi:hypothetical protein